MIPYKLKNESKDSVVDELIAVPKLDKKDILIVNLRNG